MKFSELHLVSSSSIPRGELCDLNDLSFICKLSITMEQICEREKGIGLAAVQLGVPLNFFTIKFPDAYRHFTNCNYIPLGDSKEKSLEGCLSIKDKNGGLRHFEVDRFTSIRIEGKELLTFPELKIIEVNLEPTDFYRIVFQHEIDHARQILISDTGREVFLRKN